MTPHPAREPMSRVDAAWFRMDSSANRMVITGFFDFEEHLDLDQFKKELDERLRPFERFHRRVVDPGGSLRLPYWEDISDFDIDEHVSVVEDHTGHLPETMAELAPLPFDPARPMWHAHVLQRDTGSFVFFRIHHSIGDGQALVHVLLSLCEEAAPMEHREAERRRDPKWAGAPATEPPEPAPLDVVKRVVSAPSTWARTLWRNLSRAFVLLRLLVLPPDSDTVLRGKLGVAKAYGWSDVYPVAKVRAIAAEAGATINDVLISAMSGALARYAADRGTPVGARELKAMVPVDVRPKDVVPDMGNRFGLVILTLPVSVGDPKARLAEMKQRMDAIKRRPEAGVGFGVVKLLGFIPRGVEKLLVRFFSAKASVIMTNVIGPRLAQQLAGTRVRRVMVFVPQSGRVGLGVSIFSYDGGIQVGVMSDAGLTPDPERIADLFHQELEALG